MNRRGVMAGLAALTLTGCQPKRETVSGRTAIFLRAARAQMRGWTSYDAHYTAIPYPGGDVAPGRGVCADVIVRAYRGLGIDLQKLVHEDMLAHFDLYPKLWGLKAPDVNIDHRRVPNLAVFFTRFGKTLPASHQGGDYRPGDILVTRPGGPHISIVSDRRAWFGAGDLMVIQNMGLSVQENNDLLRYPITGHFRYGLDQPA
ncbi:MAG: DUF1287 domain-containing protein [Asticcacaulis sp.]|uniref:DUF1287 domain-containing protein n=1 Tax=Asticcacaulis sp. TaxID=1872648 RepID=UPI003F7BC4EC